MSDQKVKCTLLIWEVIPEKTKLFLIPNEIADKYIALLEQAHRKFINHDGMNDGLNFLNFAVAKNGDVNGKNERGVFADYECDDASLNDVHITRVYLSGFVL